MITFNTLNIESKSLYDSYYKRFDNEVSELTFTNLFMWRKKYNFKYAVIQDFLWILNETPSGKWYFSPPIGDYSKGVEPSVLELKKYLKEQHRPFIIKKAGEKVLRKLSTSNVAFQYMADRDSFDYIYNVENLKELRGKSYHKKKNHVNKFIKTYDDWQYEPLTQENMADVLKCLESWCRIHKCQQDLDLNHEHRAIIDALDHFELLDYEGGLIRINGNVESFTLAEQLDGNTLVIHIEKASTDFSGLYNMINREYLKNTSVQSTFVNREQDMGLEGLRKSKLSYHPVKLMEKYTIELL